MMVLHLWFLGSRNATFFFPSMGTSKTHVLFHDEQVNCPVRCNVNAELQLPQIKLKSTSCSQCPMKF